VIKMKKVKLLPLFILIITSLIFVFLPTSFIFAESGGSECEQSENCELLDEPGNSGSYSSERCIDYIIIKAGSSQGGGQSGEGEFRFDKDTNDGCYDVNFSEDMKSFTWARIGDGSDCKDVSHIQVWFGTCEPEPEPGTRT